MDHDLALALNVLFHDSPRRIQQYSEIFDSLDALNAARSVLLSQVQGSYQKQVAARWDQFNPVAYRNMLAKHHITPLFLSDPDYPKLWTELDDAPPVVYAKGNTSQLKGDWLAVVGTRTATPYGHTVTAQLVSELAPLFGIVSGLARGIDTTAHTTALQLGRPTVAIVGTGIDIIYPKENEPLFHQLIEQGCILSEYPPGTPGIARQFPQRNRLISGMALGTLVVEAQEKSGALNTASHTIAQNRELFCVPGPIYSPESAGCLQLIKQGGICVTSAHDIIKEFSHLPLPKSFKPGRPVPPPKPTERPDLNPTESKIWTALGHSQIDLDRLSELTGLAMNALLPALTMMELKGMIKQHAGKRFSIE